ncbi:MAG: flagellar type III secretion system pore protein FliP [candidate division Zixibacteria bacterium]|nr:flagellar type III secretion system pore protein FliP [Candidatus Tariuqbacter arcticus]
MKTTLKRAVVFLGILMVVVSIASPVCAQVLVPRVTVGVEKADSPEEVAVTIQILIFLTVLTLAPAILIMMTSFTRLIVVFNFMKQAMGTAQVPPSQLLIGLSLFLTAFIMSPVISEVNKTALQPYLNQEISQQEALEKAQIPVKAFMLRQTREKDLALFISLSKIERPQRAEDIPLQVLVPAFVINELRVAFQIGFILYLPFLIIDMVVASVLLAMGMMMLPPVMISLPFKIILFVLADGWNLLVGSMVASFR